MYEIGIILFTCAALAIIFPLFLLFHTENPNYLWWFVVAVFLVFIGGMLMSVVPQKRDVLGGRAVYTEELNIRGQDTITTYTIVWKKDLKKKNIED